MFNSLEMQIRELLLELVEPQSVAIELSERWQRNLLSSDEQNALGLFLLRAGFDQILFKNLRRILKAQLPLPWAALAQVIVTPGFKVSRAEIQALVDGVTEQNAFKEILTSNAVASWHPAFEKKREAAKEDAASELIQKQQFLKEKMEFFRNQRMFDDEARILKELKALFPEEASRAIDELKQNEQSLEERWAREVIAGGPVPRDLEEVLQMRSEELPTDQVLVKAQIVSGALKAAHQSPHLAYDIALHLHFMEMSAEALEALQFAEANLPSDWLRLDLLLKSRKFVEALSETHKLERKYSSEPESTFAAIYARAVALWELGQKALAVELIQNIVKIRPDYKSAHSLLMAWTGGEF